MKTTQGFWSAVGIALLAAGCGGDVDGKLAGHPAGDGIGATQGGVQDIGLAREMVAQGIVPPPEAFTVEGMFSEHDLPVEGAPCTRVLCLRAALAVAPDLQGESAAWAQVGMSSTVDPSTYQRQPLSLVLTVDVSGSMGWEYASRDGESVTPGALARRLLHQIATHLDERDRVAIVTYGSTVTTALDFTPGSAQEAIHGAIDALGENGSTDMEGGLRRAFDLLRETDAGDRDRRVMLFTDVRPNVGATTATAFEDLVGSAAAADIGLTVFGLGLGLGPDVFRVMSRLKGGNAFSLFRASDVPRLMEDSWPWLVSPIAHGLKLQLSPSEGFAIGKSYGFPGEGDEPKLEVASVFLSKKRGALLLRLDRSAAEPPFSTMHLTGTLTYTTPQGEAVEEPLDAAFGDTEAANSGTHYSQPGVARSVALALLVSGLGEAAQAYGENREAAVALARASRDRYASDVAGMENADMQRELALARRLVELMETGAEQRDPYGGTTHR